MLDVQEAHFKYNNRNRIASKGKMRPFDCSQFYLLECLRNITVFTVQCSILDDSMDLLICFNVHTLISSIDALLFSGIVDAFGICYLCECQ